MKKVGKELRQMRVLEGYAGHYKACEDRPNITNHYRSTNKNKTPLFAHQGSYYLKK